jgi:adenylate cyclase
MIIDNDRIFAQGIRNMGKSFLSYSMTPESLLKSEEALRETPEFKEAQEYFFEKSTQKIDEKNYAKYETITDRHTEHIVYPIPEFIKAAHGFGFVNRDTDIDGAVRKVRLVQFFEGRLYFNLALVMLADACRITVNDIDVVPGNSIILKKALHPLTHEIDDIRIPIDESGMMYVYWAGSGVREETFKIIPFFALVEYQNCLNDAYDWFEKNPANVMAMEQIANDIMSAEEAYEAAETARERRELRAKILELLKDDREIKEGTIELISDEIELLKGEGRESETPPLENSINNINLVLSVESLKDNITLTGLTATGTVDIGQIPTSKEFAMVGVYHNTINTIIQNKYLLTAPAWLNYLLMLLVALTMGFTIQKLSARKSIITIISSFVFINIVIICVFLFGDMWLDQLGISFALLIPSVSIAAVKLMKEESQKQFIKSAFSLYLSPGVIDRIIDNPDALGLGGEEREITIFFSDVAKFSTISERLAPQELVALLNEYLSEMTDIILKHGGTVDKYEGDAIIAFFGAPQPFEDHALRCCLAAIDQKKRLAEMQDAWRAAGKDVLSVRMGMNTGVAVVGNMGSRTRFDYTVMGDSVNLASRLEGANKAYNTCAMISGSTYEYVKNDIEARRLDVIQVVGKKEPVSVYEVLDVKGALPDYMYDLLERYYKALELYNNRNWKEAMDGFKKALELAPDDGPSLTYIERCNIYLETPPPGDWGGVFELTSK